MVIWALANSVALKLARFTNLSKDPNGGTIMRTADGEPTGLLIDAAMELILSRIPEVSVDERRQAMLRASNFALTRGVTAVVDFGRYFPGAPVEHSWQDFSGFTWNSLQSQYVYQWADSSGKMIIRVCLFFPMETWSRLYDVIHNAGHALSNWIYFGGVKAFADGSLGSNSALFHEVAIHAVGDRANDLILDMYESVAQKMERVIADLGLSMPSIWPLGQQTNLANKGLLPQYSQITCLMMLILQSESLEWIGLKRFQSLISSNALLALGSDWLVTSIYPLCAIRTAMKRIPPGWENAWIPSERLSLNDALIA